MTNRRKGNSHRVAYKRNSSDTNSSVESDSSSSSNDSNYRSKKKKVASSHRDKTRIERMHRTDSPGKHQDKDFRDNLAKNDHRFLKGSQNVKEHSFGRHRSSRRSRSRSRSRSLSRSASRSRSRSPSRRAHRTIYSSKSSRRHRSSNSNSDDDERRERRERRDYSVRLSKSYSRKPVEEETRLRLQEVKRRERELRKEEKKRLKMLETPEEKRLRRLEKKERKAERKKALLAQGGTDIFEEAEQSGRFVWRKKVEAAEKKGLSRADLARLERERAEEAQREIEMIKKRRQQQEQERLDRMREKDLLLRAQDDAQFGEWADQEEVFVLKQARLRSELRLRAGRARPIDLLAKYIHTEKDDPDIDQHEPYVLFDTMPLESCEDLKEDIAVYLRLEGHLPENRAFWEDISVICEYTLKELYRQRAMNDKSLSAAERRALESGINDRVKQDIIRIFDNKTISQLLELERQIKTKLNSKDTIDIGYWETLLRELKVQFARARLCERHKSLLQHKLSILYQKQQEQQEQQEQHELGDRADQIAVPDEPSISDQDDDEGDLFEHFEEQDRSFSPVPEQVPIEEDEDDKIIAKYNALAIIPEEQLNAQTIALRKIVLMMIKEGRQGELHTDFCKNQLDMGISRREKDFLAKAKAADDMEDDDEDEETFADELNLQPSSGEYLWKDRYRPRKPRYFNRVFTGFDWNEYNRTHYDKQNPPPKMVQGYKFNIFYPDLIDKSQPPTFKLEDLPNEPGFGMIRFSAGPPYEDIAFKIVDNPWLHGRKSGYRCQFTHSNVFELYFRFRRRRYYR